MATVPTASPSSLAEEQAAVQQSLDRLLRRIRLAVWIRYASIAAIVGSVFGLAALMAWHEGWDGLPVVPVLFAVYAVPLVVATVLAFRSKIPRLAVARLADERQGLKQRLSSSLVLAEDPTVGDSAFVRLQMVDAAAIAPAIDARQVVPLRVRWESIAAVASLFLLALALGFALRSLHILQSGADLGPAAVAREGEKLAGDAQRIARQADEQKMPQTRRYADKLSKLAHQMQSRQMPPSEAVKKLSNLSAEVKQRQEQLAKQSSASADSKSNAPGGAPGSNSSPHPTPLASAPATLSETLRKLADRVSSSSLTPAQQRQMAQGLGQLADKVRQAGLSQTASHIDQAAKALQQGQQSRAASELRAAAQAAEQEEKQAAQAGAKLQSQAAGQKNQSPTAQNAQQSQGQKAPAGHEAPAQKGNQAGQKSQSDHATQAANPSQTGQGSQPGQAVDKGNQGGKESSGQGQETKDAQGLQSIERSLQDAENRLAGKSGPNNPNGANGPTQSRQTGAGSGAPQKPGSGSSRAGKGYNSQSKQGGNSQAKGGAPSNVTQSEGKGSPTSPGKYTPSQISGKGYKTPGANQGVWHGPPRQLDSYNPSKNNRYARIFLPTSSQSGRGTTKNDSTPPSGSPPAHQTSTVPYYQVYPQFKKGAEAAIDKEDIPRAYAKKVRQYFQSLTPSGH